VVEVVLDGPSGYLGDIPKGLKVSFRRPDEASDFDLVLVLMVGSAMCRFFEAEIKGRLFVDVLTSNRVGRITHMKMVRERVTSRAGSGGMRHSSAISSTE
jgi:hypothetical protein